MTVTPETAVGASNARGSLALEALTLCEAFQITAAENAERVALRTPGAKIELMFAEVVERVRNIATGLHELGVRRGDTVGLMLLNRPEFNLCDCAAMHLGATPFSIYNTCSPEQIAYLFANAANKIVITELQFLETIRAAGVRLEHIICVDGAAEGTLALEDVESLQSPGFDFDATWRAVSGEDLITICYTSGTTGPPKGVELTHANVLAECQAASTMISVGPEDRIVSYLPHAHMADRYSTHYALMLYGSQVTVVADPREVIAALSDVRPTSFGSVPRVWEKMKAGLEAAIAADEDSERKQAVRGAIDVGLRRVRAEQAGESPSPELLAEHVRADELVLSKLRERLGLAEAKMVYAGAAPTPTDVLEFFHAIGLSICEVWGMSELTCVGTCNPHERPKIGTVGLPLPGLEVRIADDGELLCRGPILMRGYRSDPDRTAEAIDEAGWLHTGDIAEIDEDGYVKIVDRKKELIINAAGKNMSPANIEAHIKSSSSLIGQAIAIGDRRPYNVALIVLDPDGAGAWAAEHRLGDMTPEMLAQAPSAQAEVARGIEQANSHLSRVEQIKRFTILPCDWLAGGDELTATMKLKRKPIAEKYSAEIAALYA
ncbi:MAG TPA: long-chain fatty acid--CoA ligase [Solirubrobacteraceae bacterium]|jgi:long-chain acyl-CoA synthetase|nr:long-chain fatty acid--CoA ligase [Solirubrobacteraceae bacterium]